MNKFVAILPFHNHRNHLIDDVQPLVFKEVQGWELIAHHATLHHGDPSDFTRPLIAANHNCMMRIDAYGFIPDKVCAVRLSYCRVQGGPDLIEFNDRKLHLTMWVNRAGGGKPGDARLITDWVKLPCEILIQGTMEVCN